MPSMIIKILFQIKESSEKDHEWKAKLLSLKLYRIVILGFISAITLTCIIVALNFQCSCFNMLHPSADNKTLSPH